MSAEFLAHVCKNLIVSCGLFVVSVIRLRRSQLFIAPGEAGFRGTRGINETTETKPPARCVKNIDQYRRFDRQNGTWSYECLVFSFECLDVGA